MDWVADRHGEASHSSLKISGYKRDSFSTTNVTKIVKNILHYAYENKAVAWRNVTLWKDERAVSVCRSLGAFAKLRKTAVSFVMSVCPSVLIEQLGSHCAYIHGIWYLSIFRKSVEQGQFWNPKEIAPTFHGNLRTFMIISGWIILRMKNASGKIKTRILCSVIFFMR